MNLPNYFLADLPPEATLGAAMIGEACLALKRNRERYLTERSTSQLATALGVIGQRWLAPDSKFRKFALQKGPAVTGFSEGTLNRGLDSFFRELTRENVLLLVQQELAHAGRFDEMVTDETEQKTNRASMVTGPEMLVHIA